MAPEQIKQFHAQYFDNNYCKLADLVDEMLTAAEVAMRERCEAAIQKRADDRFNERGTQEPDTNACYFSNNEDTARDEEDEDCIALIRALPTTKEPS